MKRAFTLIELVFTIVILAITTMAIPQIIAQTTNLNIFSLKQELVLHAKTILTQVAKAPWDTSYVATDCAAALATCKVPVRVHSTPLAAAGLSDRPYITQPLSAGGVIASTRELSIAQPTATNNFAGVSHGSKTFNDLDDYANYNTRNLNPVITGSGAQTQGDFVLNANVGITVSYVSDALNPGDDYRTSNTITYTLPTAAAAGVSNVKMVQATAVDAADAARSVVLRTYVFNVGTSSDDVVFARQP